MGVWGVGSTGWSGLMIIQAGIHPGISPRLRVLNRLYSLLEYVVDYHPLSSRFSRCIPWGKMSRISYAFPKLEIIRVVLFQVLGKHKIFRSFSPMEYFSKIFWKMDGNQRHIPTGNTTCLVLLIWEIFQGVFRPG